MGVLCTIAFFPPVEVIYSFQELVYEIRNDYNNKVDKLLNHFEDNFISRSRRNAPFFPPSIALDLWNKFSKRDDELPRTKYNVED